MIIVKSFHQSILNMNRLLIIHTFNFFNSSKSLLDTPSRVLRKINKVIYFKNILQDPSLCGCVRNISFKTVDENIYTFDTVIIVMIIQKPITLL